MAAIPSAGAQSSSHYSLSASVQDLGGGTGGNVHYTAAASIAPLTGPVSASTLSKLKPGYAGQLYEVTGLTITAGSQPAAVEGGGRIALAAWQTLDDATYSKLPSTAVTWTIPNGPLGRVGADGFANGLPVGQDTSALVQGTWGSYVATLPVTVKAEGTLPVSSITDIGATLGGSVDPNGQPTTAWFEFGTDATYGRSTQAQDLGIGNGSVRFQETLTGFVSGSVIHYRLVVTRGGTTTTYADQTFTTGVGVPALPAGGLIVLPVALVVVTFRSLKRKAVGLAG